MVPYDYQIKMRQLGVKPEVLEQYGAVSEPTIIKWPILFEQIHTDIGVGNERHCRTRCATPEKPVGLVWIAYSDKHHTVTKKLQLSTDRILNIKAGIDRALNLTG